MLKNGDFVDPDGEHVFFPIGAFANYFPAEIISSGPTRSRPDGNDLLEFQNLTAEDWKRFFEQLKRKGYTAIHLYPRGINVDDAWEGLDRGGQVNEELLAQMLEYINLAGSCGIRTQLDLFTQPETSVYCSSKAQLMFGARFCSREEAEAAPPYVRRFCSGAGGTVSYENYFLDPDVRRCNIRFLELLLPRIAENPNIFALELIHEMGWRGPYAARPNTFAWESEQAILEWGAEMIRTVRRLAPQIPVCVSTPGTGIFGYEILCWTKRLQPDFYSLHLYPQFCGHLNGRGDFASVAEFSLKYAQAGGCAMIGEWECSGHMGQLSEWDLQLCARDILWFSLLSGAPGVIARLAQSRGEYRSVHAVLQRLKGRTLGRKKPALGIDIRPLRARMQFLTQHGAEECAFGGMKWCPDTEAKDGKHRFCCQYTDPLFLQLLRQTVELQEEGLDYDLTLSPQEYKTNRPEQVRGGIRLEVPKGYRMRQKTCADGKTVIAYLQNYERKPVWERPGKELYAVRDRAPKPFAVRAADGWRPFVYDLDLRCWVDDFTVFHGTVTSHDFVVLLFREEKEKTPPSGGREE
ncbi:MAG: hypothetical protein PUC59_07275 [Firmicutes bacterium]|nr:hypothetical protein [Bacillota bacterium]